MLRFKLMIHNYSTTTPNTSNKVGAYNSHLDNAVEGDVLQPLLISVLHVLGWEFAGWLCHNRPLNQWHISHSKKPITIHTQSYSLYTKAEAIILRLYGTFREYNYSHPIHFNKYSYLHVNWSRMSRNHSWVVSDSNDLASQHRHRMCGYFEQ